MFYFKSRIKTHTKWITKYSLKQLSEEKLISSVVFPEDVKAGSLVLYKYLIYYPRFEKEVVLGTKVHCQSLENYLNFHKSV